jgi:type IV pilus assembly protein PilQ
MSTSLRLALVGVTISLFATLVWLADGGQTDWPAVTRSFLHPMRSALVQAEGTPTTNRVYRSPGTQLESPDSARHNFAASDDERERNESAALERETTRHVSMTRPQVVPYSALQHTNSTVAKSSRARDSSSNQATLVRPGSDEIQLTAGTTTDNPSTLRRTKNGFDLIVRNRDITFVFELLNSTGHTKIVPLPSVKGAITITLYDTTVEQALDAVLRMGGYLSRKEGDITLVYTQEDLEELDAVEGKVEVFTYKPRYIAAVDLMSVLTTHLSQKGKISSTKANQMGIAASSDNAGGDSLAVDDAIVIQDTHGAIVRIKQIIEDVDVRPQQVLIEAVVLKVELKDDHRLGVNFALLYDTGPGASLTVSGNGSVINGAAGFPPSSVLSAGGKVQGGFAANDHGLKYGVVTKDVTGFINMLETIGHTTVVASPKVLALNKQRAEIIVGSQLGYRTVTTTETAAVENVQFLDVGTQLRMRPFIQPNGYIRMELHPEKSNGRVSETTGLPEKDTTQVTTNLTIKSCQTIVIGGLIEEQQQKSVQQVPFLGSLPLIGRAFRDETTSIARTEIIVMITPRIIDDEQESAYASEEIERFSKRREGLEQSMPKYTRIALARKYYDRAVACRDAGDLKTARKMVELSLDFDPMHEPALELWEQLRSMGNDSATIDDDASSGTDIESPNGFRLDPVDFRGN